MRRRTFLRTVGVGAASLATGAHGAGPEPGVRKPNILWITCEDMGQHLGCYGDSFAWSPRLDALAAEGVRFTHAFAHAPVCAPARSGLITGCHPTSLGSHHMRCQATLPGYMHAFPAYLRQAGYFCTNNRKTDYNFPVPDDAWDVNSGRAHWRDRAPGQPFFTVFNFTNTHESRARMTSEEHQRVREALPEAARHDAAGVSVPSFQPDTPETRLDWTMYYDNIAQMDAMVGKILDELAEGGLADDTIVFFFSDHGAGLSRCKRWPYDSGTRVPLLVRVPEPWRHLLPAEPGTATNRLVSFVDFGPTVLRLAGLDVPGYVQGEPFAGDPATPRRKAVYVGRDRMDERYDCMRAVRTERHLYIRHFMPHRPYAQNIAYMNLMPTMQVWRRLHAEGKLSGPPALFMRARKPIEEFFDTEADPGQVNNLAGDPVQAERLQAHRDLLSAWMRETRDLGLLPEPEMHRLEPDGVFWELGHNPARYPLESVMEVAVDLPLQGTEAVPALRERLADSNAYPAVRYWAAMGLAALDDHTEETHDALRKALQDSNIAVRLGASEALTYLGHAGDAESTLVPLLSSPERYVRLYAANLVDVNEHRSAKAQAALAALAGDPENHVQWVAKHALENSLASGE